MKEALLPEELVLYHKQSVSTGNKTHKIYLRPSFNLILAISISLTLHAILFFLVYRLIWNPPIKSNEIINKDKLNIMLVQNQRNASNTNISKKSKMSEAPEVTQKVKPVETVVESIVPSSESKKSVEVVERIGKPRFTNKNNFMKELNKAKKLVFDKVEILDGSEAVIPLGEDEAIFDPRLRKKLQEQQQLQAYNKPDAPPAEDGEFIQHPGKKVLVKGDYCIDIYEYEHLGITQWLTPRRCAWAKTESEKMAKKLSNLANKAR